MEFRSPTPVDWGWIRWRGRSKASGPQNDCSRKLAESEVISVDSSSRPTKPTSEDFMKSSLSSGVGSRISLQFECRRRNAPFVVVDLETISESIQCGYFRRRFVDE